MTNITTTRRTFTLQQARSYIGLTQIEMAEELGVTERTYIQYEKYRWELKVSLALKFSEVTGINLEDIKFF